jgi:hypothetical protein
MVHYTYERFKTRRIGQFVSSGVKSNNLSRLNGYIF